MTKARRHRYETAGVMALGGAHRQRASARVRLRWLRNLLALLTVLVAAGGLWLTLDERFYIYDAEVLGADRVASADLFEASGLSGLHILWVDSDEIEADIRSAFPTLKRAEVVCGLPAKCTIAVIQREPEVVWKESGDAQSAGQVWWIDAEGVVFPDQGMFPGGWEVRGPLPRDEDNQLKERVRVAITELLAAETDVSQLFYYIPGRGLVFTDARGGRIVLGEGAGMTERLRVLHSLMDDLEARGLTPQVVDVRFPEAPYYSLSNNW